MELELFVNGERTDYSVDGSDSTWDAFVGALSGNLARQGWIVDEARLDGQPQAALAGTNPDLSKGRHKVEVSAHPSDEFLLSVAEEMREVLPAFAQKTVELGETFARGEWRAGLASTNKYVEELAQVLVGVHSFCTLRGEPLPPVLGEVTAVLARLQEHLSKQGWVEIGDLFLHELHPLLANLQQYLQDRSAG